MRLKWARETFGRTDIYFVLVLQEWTEVKR